MERRPGSRRPKTFWGDKRSLTLLARNNLKFSAKDLKQAVASKGGPSASIRTIQRSLRDSGYMKKRARKDPDLTVSQMEKRRLEFSLQMKGLLWDKVFITDECLYLHRNTIKYWAKGKDKPHKKMDKFSHQLWSGGLYPTKGFT